MYQGFITATCTVLYHVCCKLKVYINAIIKIPRIRFNSSLFMPYDLYAGMQN